MRNQFGPISALAVALFATLPITAAMAQDPATFSSMPIDQLARRSWETTSQSEKLIIRNYIAKTYPETAFGLWAKGWIASYDGQEATEVIAIYRQAIEKDPKFLSALLNLAGQLKGKEKIEVYEKMLALNPAYSEYGAIRGEYFAYVDDLKDQSTADSFLTDWEKRLPGVYAFDFIRGLHAEYNLRDNKKAEQYYLRAVDKHPDDFEPYQRLTDLRLNKLSDANVDVKTRSELLMPVADYVARRRAAVKGTGQYAIGLDDAYIYLGDKFMDVFNLRREAFDMYREAFHVHETAEAAVKAFNVGLSNFDQEVTEYLLHANKQLPHNVKILTTLGSYYADHLSLDKAETYLQEAIATAPSEKDRVAAVRELGQEVYENGQADFARARQLYSSHMKTVSPANRGKLMAYLMYCEMQAGDFTEAVAVLGAYEKFLRDRKQDPSAAFYAGRRSSLSYLTSAAERARKYDEANPLQRAWRNVLGDRDRVAVEFAAGSSTVPDSAASDLGKLGRLMTSNIDPAAGKYVLLVEGHSDEGEADAGSLADRRARAVAQELATRFNVPPDRMDIMSMGAAVRPAGPGEKASRVEIRPAGSLAQPRISTTSALEPRSEIAVSPDGRYLALGNDPMQLWDPKAGIRVRNLGRGSFRKFSPNGRYLASASHYTEIGDFTLYSLHVFDVATGQTICQVVDFDKPFRLDWSPDSQRIAYTDEMSRLKVIEVPSGRRLRARRVWEDRRIAGQVLWSADGRYIVTGQGQDKVLHVWDAATLKPVRTLDGVDWPHALAQTPDFKYLICADNRRTLSIWDTATWSLRQVKMPVFRGSAHGLAVSPRGDKVFVGDDSGGEHPRLIAVDVRRAAIVADEEAPESDAEYAVSPDGKRLYQALAARLNVLDPATLKPLHELSGTAVRAWGTHADPAHGLLVTMDALGVHVWDVRTGKKVHVWSGRLKKLASVTGEPSHFLAVAEDVPNNKTILKLLDTSDFTEKVLLTTPLEVSYASMNKDRLVVAGRPFVAKQQFAPATGSILIYNRADLKPAGEIAVPFATDYLVYRQLYNTMFETVDLTPDGSEALVVTSWQDGFGHPQTYSKYARLFNVKTGQSRNVVTRQEGLYSANFIGDGSSRIRTGSKSGYYMYDKVTGTYVGSEDWVWAEGYKTLRDGRRIRWSQFVIDLLPADAKEISLLPPGSVHINTEQRTVGVEVFEDLNLLAALDASNEIHFYDLTTFENTLTVVSQKDNEWLAYTPSGEFASSINGTQKAYWSVGDRLLPFEALKSRFERPQLISQKLAVVSRHEKPAAPDKPTVPTFDPGLFVVPYTVTVLSENNFETTEDTYRLKIKVTRARPDVALPKFVYNQQGRDIAVEPAGGGAVSDIYEKTFSLADGLNVIQVSIDHMGAKIMPQIIFIKKKTPVAAAPTTDLWFLGIGVSDYAPPYNLTYAHEDAKEIADLLGKQKGKLYKDVHTKLLLNEKATNQEIKVAMNEFLRQASSRDVVVIFVAGHGVQDSDQALYFMPADSDPRKPYTGTNILDFSRFLQARPPTQKALFLMDICHAGAYETQGRRGDPLSMEEAIKQLYEGTGVVVLAATTGREQSLEGKEFRGGHGAFSAAFLDALDGQAEGLLAADGYVTISTLQQYVCQRVPKMTNGRQHPTTPDVKQLRDFPFFTVRR